MHHKRFNGNYGLSITFWDKWINSEYKDYVDKFDEIHQRK